VQGTEDRFIAKEYRALHAFKPNNVFPREEGCLRGAEAPLNVFLKLVQEALCSCDILGRIFAHFAFDDKNRRNSRLALKMALMILRTR
jgi:hypothetical protein